MSVARQLGNNRMPYCIFVDFKSIDLLNRNEIAATMSIDKQVIIMNDIELTADNFIGDTVTTAHAETLLTAIINCHKTICIVFGKADLLANFETGEVTEFAAIFNEVHLQGRKFTTKMFNEVKQYGETTAYVRRLIDTPDIIAFKPNKGQFEMLKWQGKHLDYQPWFTILFCKSTNEALQIVWDTREILGYTVLNQQQAEALFACGHANDNCTLLYDLIGLEQPTAFDNFIIDKIQ